MDNQALIYASVYVPQNELPTIFHKYFDDNEAVDYNNKSSK